MELFEVRKINSEDKKIINSWWNSFGHPGCPDDVYPELTLMVTYDGVPVCSGSAYLTDSKVMYFDNYVSDHSFDKETRDLSLDLLTKSLLDKARSRGYKYWVANAKQKCVADRTIKFKRTQLGEGHYWFTGEI